MNLVGGMPAGAVDLGGSAQAASAGYPLGAINFGPAHSSLWEEQPSLRELYDQACAGLVRAECEVEELRAEVAMLREQARILARPSPHFKQPPRDALVDADSTPETLSSVAWATDVSGWPTYLVVNALVAQKLERERDEARAMLEGKWHEQDPPLIKMMEERDEARDTVLQLRKQRAIARNFGEQMQRERNLLRVQAQAGEQLGLALVKTIDELKAEKAAIFAQLVSLQAGSRRATLDEIAESVREKYQPEHEREGMEND